jgi:hypothetical protein
VGLIIVGYELVFLKSVRFYIYIYKIAVIPNNAMVFIVIEINHFPDQTETVSGTILILD